MKYDEMNNPCHTVQVVRHHLILIFGMRTPKMPPLKSTESSINENVSKRASKLKRLKLLLFYVVSLASVRTQVNTRNSDLSCCSTVPIKIVYQRGVSPQHGTQSKSGCPSQLQESYYK